VSSEPGEEGEDGRAEPAAPVEVPIGALAPDTLAALIESFVLREGTDYGAVERSLASRVADVRRQLERGEAKLAFDPATETVNIVAALPARRACK
jgi:uncharacterized protein YheU (UPF0270 family)